jgi:hypothetical protein
MTPEELNRAMEFIIESQARLAAAQEQDRQDRLEFEKWSKDLSAKVVLLLDHQSERLDQHSERLDHQDAFYREALMQNQENHREVVDLQKQALHLLHLILDRLPPAQN